MNNSSKYRKPPLRRTRDSFIDDVNSQQHPREDLGKGRHNQIRRDKDKTRNVGVTLYDIDFSVKSFVDQQMKMKFEDGNESISVPTIYANAEKWASIQKDGFLKDKKGKTIVPLITFRRSNVAFRSDLRRNKVATTNQIAYIMQQKYNRTTPYDRFSTQSEKKRPFEYFITSMPDYVDLSYDFIAWCEYQDQLNYIIENFIWYSGQAFGDKNYFKFSTIMDSISIENSNTTGQDRVIKASFQIIVHGYLLPKHIAAESTTKRIISPNKINFVSELFGDINSVQDPSRVRIGDGTDASGRSLFGNLNDDAAARLRAWELRKQRMFEIAEGKSAGVYPEEND
jgi:hypothetical protein